MQRHLIISPYGKDIDTLFQVVRTFPTKEIIILADKKDLHDAKKFEKDVERFRIPTRIMEITSYSIDEIFKSIKLITESRKEKNILINVASGNKATSCLALCAAYVYGITAVGVADDRVFPYPIMRFSYHKLLSEQKLRILTYLHSRDQDSATIEELSSNLEMNPPLLSYHINGSQKAEGLKTLGLVESAGSGKKIRLRLTELGRMLAAGYI